MDRLTTGAHVASGAPSGAQTPSLTAFKRHPDLLHHKSDDNQETDGIYTPGHAHHFSNKGIDPTVLNSSLKKHIAAGAHQGERRLNDFSAEPDERMNPHFADHVKDIVNAPEDEEAKPSDEAPAEETKA